MAFVEQSWDQSYDTVFEKSTRETNDVDAYANYTNEWIELLKKIFDASDVYWDVLQSLVRNAGFVGKCGYGIDEFEKLRGVRQRYKANPKLFNELSVGTKGIEVRSYCLRAGRFVHLHIARE
jgi:hypothetical protein